MKYKISDSTLTDTFELIDAADGFIHVVNKKQIDREDIDDFLQYITIDATEEYEQPISCPDDVSCTVSTNCTLQILDINDNTPEFEFQTYTAWVKENIGVGDVMIFNSSDGTERITISDADKESQNNRGSIKFVNETLHEFFTITPTVYFSQGDINFLNRKEDNSLLDREENSESIEFKIQAIDTNENQRTATATLKINIVDINDNVPEFEKPSYAITIKEDLSNVTDNLIEVKATDKDITDKYGTKSIVYKITDGTQIKGIHINDLTGMITVDKSNIDPDDFDADKNDPGITVDIEARDCSGGDCEPKAQTATTTLTITVTNVNDNYPENIEACEDEFFNTKLDEDVLTLGYTDNDGDNATFMIKPEFLDDKFPFTITEDKGKIKLDTSKIVEVNKTFIFEVELTDSGDPSLMTNIKCEMKVNDINDKAPVFVFPETDQKYWINDNSPVDEILPDYYGTDLQIKAADGDVNECFHTLGYEFDSSKPDFKPEYLEFFR